jgi:hypothetical protein
MAGQGFNEARVIRRVVQRFAQPHDRSVQAVVKIDESIIGPKPLPKFFPGDDFAAPFQQNCENPARLLLKLDLSALLPKFTRAHINLVDTEADELRRKGGLFARSQEKQWQEYTPGSARGSKQERRPQVIQAPKSFILSAIPSYP